ncbi:MAG TPA: ComEA family DNA-binding protein [Solirubrobacterales bacterium]|nr:ComEA family DNA-binding protein [Solirubrobacterales bacterium]
MPELTRSQLFVYAAVAVALLLVGARAIRAEGRGESFGSAPAATPTAEGGGGVTVSSAGPGLVVDVAGAVQDPGVYRLPAGSRVVDALARAGGPAPGAALETVNRAARLVDGQQVVVPKRGPAEAVGVGSPGLPSDTGPIGLGTATVEQLDTIDGIGPVTAQKIVEFRDRHGGLASVDQLDEVSGIGPATMESLRARLQP